MENYDFAIIGAGIVGLAIGMELLQDNPGARVGIFEKESYVGMHASGRNSGVVHAGFYYSPDSLKAKLTREGNALLSAFAEENDVALKRTGKVVVAQRESEIAQIMELEKRGLANGVDVRVVEAEELKLIEPRARTVDVALWSPNTAVSDPKKMIAAFARRFTKLGGEIHLDTKVLQVDSQVLTTSHRKYGYKHLINASGLYADKIARPMGFSKNYTMLPFIGLYHYAPKLKGLLQSHIYPVPDPRNPFLGVHLTTTLDGSVKVGPTAIPVISREQYGLTQGLSVQEMIEILSVYPLFFSSPHHDVWSLMMSELPKHSKRFLVNQAQSLAPGIKPSDFSQKGTPGIRAQLFDIQNKRLEMDFVIEGDENSTHILNAVSPAWTSSISFAKHVLNSLKARRIIN